MIFFLFLILFFSICIDAMGHPAGNGEQVYFFVPAGIQERQKPTEEKIKHVLSKNGFVEFVGYLDEKNIIITNGDTVRAIVEKLKKSFTDYRVQLDDGKDSTRRKMGDLMLSWSQKLPIILKELGFDENIS